MSDELIKQLLHPCASDTEREAAARIRGLEAELDEARETNHSFHRRLQKAEGPPTSAVAKAEKYQDLGWKSWRSEFDRVLGAFDQMKQVYEIAAKVLGLPYGVYHSVMDTNTTNPEWQYEVSWMDRVIGKIVARPIVDGEVAGPFPVVDAVRDAVAKIEADASTAADRIAELERLGEAMANPMTHVLRISDRDHDAWDAAKAAHAAWEARNAG